MPILPYNFEPTSPIVISDRTIEKNQMEHFEKIQIYEETMKTVNEHDELRDSVLEEIVRANLLASL